MRKYGRERRREQAEVRKAERAKRTAQEQWKVLDKRLGLAKGAHKEREKLSSIIFKN